MASGAADIEAFTMGDYDEALALWKATPGMGLSGADERESLSAFLERNPGLSFVARSEGKLVGTALCGTDGRRGFLYHLAVRPDLRGRGLGGELARSCLSALAARGVGKCHLFVLADNAIGAAFWKKEGWKLRDDLLTFSKET